MYPIHLTRGAVVSNKWLLTNARVRSWKYASECADVLGGLMPGSSLTVEEVCKTPGSVWFKLGMAGRFPPAFLKLSGEEFAWNMNPPSAASAPAPATIDEAIATIQREFPEAAVRITGRARTVQRQAELMAERRVKARQQFLSTYRPAPHITEMDRWVTEHPSQPLATTTNAFEQIIRRALERGAVVSHHLSDSARDISIPQGGAEVQRRVRSRLESMGCHVIDEHDAVGGPHWHVDFGG